MVRRSKGHHNIQTENCLSEARSLGSLGRTRLRHFGRKQLEELEFEEVLAFGP
jgi:hypothetical protein